MSKEAALKQLGRLSREDALAALALIEKKRKEEHPAKYWSSKDGVFFDKIEEDFKAFDSSIKIFGTLGGNRSSKSHRTAFIAIAFLLGKEYFRDEPSWRYVQHLPIPDKGVNIWVVGLDYNVIRDVLWGEKIRPLLPKDAKIVTRASDSDFRVSVNVNGRVSNLTCKSADSGREKFQSASVDLIVIDEECEKDVFQECYQRTVDCSGKILLALTPLTDIASSVREPWVYDLYMEWKEGRTDVRFVKLSVLDNPYVPADEKQKLLEVWAGHPEEKARIYGDFVARAGLVYKTWSAKKHGIPRTAISKDWYHAACIDPAPTGPTACVWVALNPNGDMYLYDVYKQADMTVEEHAKNILVQNSGEKIDLWLIDPKGGSQRNAETHRTPADLYRDAGIPVRYAQVTTDYGLQSSMQYMNATLDATARHPKFYIFDDLHIFKEEISRYVWSFVSKGEMRGMSRDRPAKGMDDCLNAWQYLCAQFRGRKPPQRIQAVRMSDTQRREQARVNSYT